MYTKQDLEDLTSDQESAWEVLQPHSQE